MSNDYFILQYASAIQIQAVAHKVGTENVRELLLDDYRADEDDDEYIVEIEHAVKEVLSFSPDSSLTFWPLESLATFCNVRNRTDKDFYALKANLNESNEAWQLYLALFVRVTVYAKEIDVQNDWLCDLAKLCLFGMYNDVDVRMQIVVLFNSLALIPDRDWAFPRWVAAATGIVVTYLLDAGSRQNDVVHVAVQQLNNLLSELKTASPSAKMLWESVSFNLAQRHGSVDQ
jgi:hypothetical protein